MKIRNYKYPYHPDTMINIFVYILPDLSQQRYTYILLMKMGSEMKLSYL